VSTRELIPLLCGLGTLIALSYLFDIEPKTSESLLLVIPMIVVTFAVDWVLDRREERS
jgi:hypothetical protein